MKQAPVAITMGDPSGIGPEIVAKAFAREARPPAIVLGDPAAIMRAARIVGGACAVVEVSAVEAVDWQAAGTIPVLATSGGTGEMPFGRVDARSGHAAHAAIVAAIDLALAGRLRAIVTAPINKEALKAAGIAHPGHTEILAERTGTSEFGMMLANEHLRVMLVSIHVPLAEAVRLVTTERVFRAIRLAAAGARAFGVARPRVAVAGLNPHAGENGLFGREDIEAIAPAVREAVSAGIDASGPWPPDTVFMQAREGRFDVVVAQYHDQGLIPVKYLGLDDGVNVTVGLPFVRTSVDHGTAFDIAGTGRASEASLVQALRVAQRMTGT